MHVFIDTNILLNFFHFTKDELDSLNDVFASHEHGSATVHLTEQVCNEFRRNRESKIKDALTKFKETKFSPQFPSFMKGYDEYGEIRKLCNHLRNLQKSILTKVEADISVKDLVADRLIDQIFESSEIVPVTTRVYREGSMRSALGNPPGKNDSIGDAINWALLLGSVPDGQDVHIISEDGDFYATLDDQRAHPFLTEEWERVKGARLFVYRTLSGFMSEHFDGVAFSFDKDKEALIEELFDSGSFAQTHNIVAKLENYRYFSAKEVIRILDAAVANNQFGGIITDYDVSDFLNRVAVPHMDNITSAEHRRTIEIVIEERRERGS
ncbi:PIN domain-containing protein [Thioalkalivibrio sp. ALJ7]|uniref:PIN domain-containing protein n=1 Tax=Thioalkalivibrio sp. ALJ7 TaxID=1158756 RepID=UPI0003643D6C|nr:PIN domain-containing protein [Thioalkalivibrio sp. ALJ7]